jgi:allantoin racemase
MTTRIAVIGTGAGPQGNATPPKEIAAVARAPYQPALIETKLSVFPGTPYQRGLAAIGYIEAGIRAQDEGYGAVFINTFGDYGIAELKSALTIPVVGAGETALSLATTLGRKFAIVTIWPTSLNFIYDERLQSTQMQSRCVGVFNVLVESEMAQAGTSDDPVAAMRAAKAHMIDRIVTAADKAIAAGADTIILGCTCMAPIGKLIASKVKVPVIEPMTTGYLACETALHLNVAQSKAAFPAPPTAALQATRDLVAGHIPVPAEEECGMCVVASAAE